MISPFMKIENLTPEIAEICGIHAGDGHLRKNGKEFEISGSYEEREYYDAHVIPLINFVLGLNIKGKFFPSKGTYGFSISSKALISLLIFFGFPKGKKDNIVQIPEQILHSQDPTIRRAFLRGIFDTDGCITFDKRSYNTSPFKKTRNYYPRILFSTISKKLAIGIKELCEKEGFICKIYVYKSKKQTESLKYKLQMVGINNLERWMNIIIPKNSVKVSRYLIWKRYGFCPTNTKYEERTKILKGELDPNIFYGLVV